jgi:hypothetical protein
MERHVTHGTEDQRKTNGWVYDGRQGMRRKDESTRGRWEYQIFEVERDYKTHETQFEGHL